MTGATDTCIVVGYALHLVGARLASMSVCGKNEHIPRATRLLPRTLRILTDARNGPGMHVHSLIRFRRAPWTHDTPGCLLISDDPIAGVRSTSGRMQNKQVPDDVPL